MISHNHLTKRCAMRKMAYMPNTPDDFITSAEVCAELGIDRSTLTRWVQAGRIKPATKLPGLRGPYLFTRSEVARVKAEVAA